MDKEQVKNKLIEFNSKVFEESTTGLLGGRMGGILFGSHLSRLTKDTSLWQDCLGDLFEEVNSDSFNFPSYNYSVGLTGFCFGMTLLHQNEHIDFDPDEHLIDFDRTLFSMAKTAIQNGYVDFLHEGMGVLHYFNQRSSNEEIRKYTTELAAVFLANMKEENQVYYKSTIGGMAGYGCDLGLAHGLCGQLLILMNTWENGIFRDSIEEQLIKSLDFIISEKKATTPTRYSLYPSGINIETGEREFYDRNAWCYGDVNQALLFYKAHTILGDKKYLDNANEIGDVIATRMTYTSNILDENSHFCHGSSGMAQFYYALFRASKQDRYWELYEFWIEKTASDFCNDMNVDILDAKQYQLLDGIGAAGLVLSSHLLEDDRDWDRLFLLQ